MIKCCPFFRRRKHSYAYGEPLLISNKATNEESSPSSIENAGHTPKRNEELEGTREELNSLSMVNDGFNTLHLTRFSCEERQFSWQVRTAIELEESLNPLILTAIEMEESIVEKKEEEENSRSKDGTKEEDQEEMHTAIEWSENGIEKTNEDEEEKDDEIMMITALEYMDGAVEETEGGTKKDRENTENEKDEYIEREESLERKELERWRESIDNINVQMDETDGFGTGIVQISKPTNECDPITSSINSPSVDRSFHSVDLSTPLKSICPLGVTIRKQPRTPSFINF